MTISYDDIGWGAYASLSVGLESNMTQINRKTESFLDVLSSCGGLMRALYLITSLLMGSYNRHALNFFLTHNLVRFVASKSDNKDRMNSKEEEFKSQYLA